MHMHGAQQHLWMHASSLQKCIWTRTYTLAYIYTYTHVHIYMYTCIYIYIHTHTMHICMDIYIYTYAYICTHTYMYIYMHMHTCIYISPQLVHARLCNGAAASLPWKLLWTYLESCANIMQAVVSARPPALCRAGRPPAGPLPYMFAKKCVQIHASSWRGRCCSVAHASSDHPRWCEPHPVCQWFTLAHGCGSHPRQKSIFTAIFAGFVNCCYLESLPTSRSATGHK